MAVVRALQTSAAAAFDVKCEIVTYRQRAASRCRQSMQEWFPLQGGSPIPVPPGLVEQTPEAA